MEAYALESILTWSIFFNCFLSVSFQESSSSQANDLTGELEGVEKAKYIHGGTSGGGEGGGAFPLLLRCASLWA